MCTLANGEDPDEMPHIVTFHQGSLLFPKAKKDDLKRNKNVFLIMTINSRIIQGNIQCIVSNKKDKIICA